MTIAIADACALVQSKAPAPVILVDTCNFLDIFRPEPAKPRVPAATPPRKFRRDSRCSSEPQAYVHCFMTRPPEKEDNHGLHG